MCLVDFGFSKGDGLITYHGIMRANSHAGSRSWSEDKLWHQVENKIRHLLKNNDRYKGLCFQGMSYYEWIWANLLACPENDETIPPEYGHHRLAKHEYMYRYGHWPLLY